ncbi:hypothetical protein M2251_005363 [Rhodococcus erythropolis]|nr:hypothetical protein [Rhodococcus erythropolis]
MAHFDNDDGLAYDDDPADFWDLADRAHETGAGK